MLHFADRFLVFLLADLFQAPMAVHARVKEVLIDGAEFIGQLAIE